MLKNLFSKIFIFLLSTNFTLRLLNIFFCSNLILVCPVIYTSEWGAHRKCCSAIVNVKITQILQCWWHARPRTSWSTLQCNCVWQAARLKIKTLPKLSCNKTHAYCRKHTHTPLDIHMHVCTSAAHSYVAAAKCRLTLDEFSKWYSWVCLRMESFILWIFIVCVVGSYPTEETIRAHHFIWSYNQQIHDRYIAEHMVREGSCTLVCVTN